MLGLFGGIASGKSRVASLLAGRGALVLDADRLAHEALLRPEVRDEVVAALGAGVLGTDGRIDRKAVGAVVFGDRGKLARLEAILHPPVLAALAEAIAGARSAPGEPRRVVALDAPLLAEAGGLGLCEEILYVDAALETRRLGQAEKRARATYVIDNDGDLAATSAAVDRFWRERIAPKTGVG